MGLQNPWRNSGLDQTATPYRPPTFGGQQCHVFGVWDVSPDPANLKDFGTQGAVVAPQGHRVVPETIPLGYLGYPWVAQDPRRNCLWDNYMTL